MVKSETHITDIKDVPDFEAMSGEDIIDWLETVDLSYELHEKLFPKTTLEEDCEYMGWDKKALESA